MKENKYRVYNKVMETMHYPDWEELASRAVLPEMKVMQYVGIKDKKDKDIYEGDICRVKGGWSGDVIVQMYDLHNYHFWGEVSDNLDAGATYEIIGNIYQNPELLDKKHRDSNGRPI